MIKLYVFLRQTHLNKSCTEGEKTKQTSKQTNSFYIKKEKKEIKDRINRDIRTLFEQQEEDYYKPKRVSNFWSNNYIEYESNCDKNRNLSLVQFLNKIEPYLSSIIIDFQNSDTWKIQLTIVINFLSSKDAEKERVLHSRSNNMKITSYNDVNEVVDELFDWLRSRYQENLETSMRRSDFILIQFSWCITNVIK